MTTLKHAQQHMGYRDGTLTWLEVVDVPDVQHDFELGERWETEYKGDGYLVSRFAGDTAYHLSSRCETISSGYKTAKLGRTALLWWLDLRGAHEYIIKVDIFYNHIPAWREWVDVEDRFTIEDDMHGTINVTDTDSGRTACVGYGEYDCGENACHYSDKGAEQCQFCFDPDWYDYCPSCTARYLESVCEALAAG